MFPKMVEVVRTVDKATIDQPIIVTTGVGAHQMVVAREFSWDYPARQLLTSGGHGTMGFGLPAAVGAAITCPDVTVVCFDGDGSFGMDMLNLAVIAERRLNIKIVILDNRSYGIVRQFEDEKGYKNVATANLWNPVFDIIAQAYRIANGYFPRAAGVSIDEAVGRAFEKAEPYLLAVRVADYAA